MIDMWLKYESNMMLRIKRAQTEIKTIDAEDKGVKLLQTGALGCLNEKLHKEYQGESTSPQKHHL